jgi:signal transduction histidine kinase
VDGVYDELPDAVLVADEVATVTGANAAAEELLNRSADELVGRHISDALGLYDVEGRDWWSCVRPYDGLSTRTRLVETSWFLPDAREVLVTARLVRAVPRGPVTQVVVCLRDGSVRRRSDRIRSDLVATVAHELRSPLTGVKGFTSTLLAKWDRFSDQQRRLMLETVDSDADRLTRLIAELLDVARIDSGRLTLRRQPVDLKAAVRTLLSSYPLGDNRTLALRLHDVPEVWVDPDKLSQVLTNLLDNAVRHGDGEITVGVAPEGDRVDVWVEDCGTGVPPEMRERVFAKYWRHGERTGTGLGLYIVHGLVSAHGGEMRVESGDAGGARFRASFPTGAPPGLEA